MGYDLHITRKANWTDDDGDTITPAEWLSVLDSDPELSRATDTGNDTPAGAWNGDPLFQFDDGQITCKNADKAIIRKMVHIAERLGARVQGDDGEIYRQDGTSFEPETPTPKPASLLSRINTWLQLRRTSRSMQQAAPKFRVGQRVKNLWGQLGTVIKVDAKADHGLGSLRVRFDNGVEDQSPCFSSPYRIVDDAPTGDDQKK